MLLTVVFFFTKTFHLTNVLKRNMPHPITDLPLLEIQTNRAVQASTQQINVQLDNVPSVSTASYVSFFLDNIIK